MNHVTCAGCTQGTDVHIITALFSLILFIELTGIFLIFTAVVSLETMPSLILRIQWRPAAQFPHSVLTADSNISHRYFIVILHIYVSFKNLSYDCFI